MRKLYHTLRRGQSFHHEGRLGKDGTFNCNGTVGYVNWEDSIFEVFYSKGEKEEYDIDDILGCWDEKLGGYWHYVA